MKLISCHKKKLIIIIRQTDFDVNNIIDAVLY